MRVLNRSRCRRPRRGAAAVELALIIPLMALITIGAVDYGRFAYDLIAVTNAARTGASYGIMNNYSGSTQATWQANVAAAARAELAGQDGYVAANVTVPTPVVVVDGNGLRRVRVTVNYTFTTVGNWNWFPVYIPQTTTLSRTAEMRLIR